MRIKECDTFSEAHPAILMAFFAFVILTGVFVLHPLLLGISLAGAVAYCVYLKRGAAVKLLLGMLVFMLVAIVINPLFNHTGDTVLLHLGGNPITLEAVLFGVASAGRLGAVMLWFSCYAQVMRSDKFMYLFGRIIPALSLVFSMGMGFVPRYTQQFKKVAAAQRAAGQNFDKNKRERLKNGIMVLSIVTTWALENAVETADSMKARGYGLKGRTTYSIYRFAKRDKLLLGALLTLLALILLAMALGVVSVQYFPFFAMSTLNARSLLVGAAYAGVCFLPLVVNGKEAILWRFLISKA